MALDKQREVGTETKGGDSLEASVAKARDAMREQQAKAQQEQQEAQELQQKLMEAQRVEQERKQTEQKGKDAKQNIDKVTEG